MRWTEADYLRHINSTPKSFASLRRQKFGNERADGFDSKKERTRYEELELLEKAGEIRNLRRQVRYALVVNGQHICDYIADHVYEEGAVTVVEDTKSIATRKLPVYRIKSKLMKACHDIDIRET